MNADVIVLGAGAAGLVCAAQCGQRGRSVVVLDRSPEPARKVRISGGGRCNITNTHVTPSHYISRNPHFVRSALSQYPPESVLRFLAGHGITLVEEDHGRLFCRQGSQAVVRALTREALDAGARLVLGERIESTERAQDGYRVHTHRSTYSSRSLVVATGGPAWPQIGSSDYGHRVASEMGLTVTEVEPGLVPLLTGSTADAFCRALSGISLPVHIPLSEISIDDILLFTHTGISGPATLDTSLFWRPGQVLEIDLCPNVDILGLLDAHPRRETRNALSRALPSRLAALLAEANGWTGNASSLARSTRASITRLLHAYPFSPAGKESMQRAEVTMGGVDTAQISSKTMEAKTMTGLFFAGEVLDVAGRLGGYNLQWAFSSGYVAGRWA